MSVRQVERAYDVASPGAEQSTVRIGIAGAGSAVLSIHGSGVEAGVQDIRDLLGALARDLDDLTADRGASGVAASGQEG